MTSYLEKSTATIHDMDDDAQEEKAKESVVMGFIVFCAIFLVILGKCVKIILLNFKNRCKLF